MGDVDDMIAECDRVAEEEAGRDIMDSGGLHRTDRFLAAEGMKHVLVELQHKRRLRCQHGERSENG